MLTRRDILGGTLATVAIMHPRPSLAKPSQPATPVNFDVPAGACDCHTHIHGDPEKFPFFAGRTYTPEVALPEEMAALHKALHMQRVVIVFDHFGGAKAELGPQQPGFADLVELVRSGKAYVKVSAGYRVSSLPDYADLVPLAQALIAANPERVVWGTDWPHPTGTPPGGKATDVTPLLQIDDGRLLNQLPVWAPDAAIRKKILVDNPARLYAF
jgi:predicted TIM-barrel fold metal-dependent hydrolase